MHSDGSDKPPVLIIISKRFQRKDTVPPHKSITRGQAVKATPSPKGVPVAAPKAAAKAQVKRAAPIPKSSVSRGIRMPKQRGARADGIKKRLQKTSPWYQSILDPITGADAKIPDDTGVETGTVQLIYKSTVTTNSNGMCGFRLKTPYINKGGTDLASANVQEVDPTSGALSVGWGAKTGATWTLGDAWPLTGCEDLRAIASHHRVVSAALYVQPECSLADNRGEFVVFTDPFHNMITPQYTDYVNHFKSAVIPVNANVPGVGRWYPIMVDDNSFKAFEEMNAQDVSEIIPWNIGFIANGCEADIPFRVTVAINYEFLPMYNTINVLDTSPSPQDTQEIDLVENWVQDMDVATVTTNRVVSTAPKTVTPQHGENDGDTGFGMMFNVLKEILPFATLLL